MRHSNVAQEQATLPHVYGAQDPFNFIRNITLEAGLIVVIHRLWRLIKVTPGISSGWRLPGIGSCAKISGVDQVLNDCIHWEISLSSMLRCHKERSVPGTVPGCIGIAATSNCTHLCAARTGCLVYLHFCLPDAVHAATCVQDACYTRTGQCRPSDGGIAKPCAADIAVSWKVGSPAEPGPSSPSSRLPVLRNFSSPYVQCPRHLMNTYLFLNR